MTADDDSVTVTDADTDVCGVVCSLHRSLSCTALIDFLILLPLL